MTDIRHVLLAIAPRGKPAILDGLAAAWPDVARRADLTTPRRIAHFLGQVAHESAGFATTTEYDSGAAYEGRRNLGNTSPGDGKRFKGRGLLQITGRANYGTYGAALGVNLESRPEQAALFPVAALTAAEYWREHRLNEAADRDDVITVTRKINGGLNGLDSRKTFLARAEKALAGGAPDLLRVAAAESRAKAATATKASLGASMTSVGAVPAASKASMPPWAGVGLALALAAVAGFAVWKARTASSHAKELDAAADAAKQGG